MKTFILGLKVSGQIQFVLGIRSTDLRSAKREWARLTGHLDTMWNARNQTYFRWPVVETDIEPLQRKTPTGYFSY